MAMMDDKEHLSCITRPSDNGVYKQLYTPHPFRSWMADNFDLIKGKTLMEITLPGIFVRRHHFFVCNPCRVF